MVDLSVSDVLSLTQDMMMTVVEEQWDELVDMQIRQDEMLRQLFAADGEMMFSDAEKEDLVEVQRLNQEILSAAEKHKSDIAHELRAMRQGKAKASVYQSL